MLGGFAVEITYGMDEYMDDLSPRSRSIVVARVQEEQRREQAHQVALQRLEAVNAKIEESRARNVGALQQEIEEINQDLEAVIQQKIQSDKELFRLLSEKSILEMQLGFYKGAQEYVFNNLN